MKFFRHVHLAGDPFEFCRAYDYKARELEIEKRLMDTSSLEKLNLLLKNLTWVMRRALIVFCELNNKKDVDDIWRKDNRALLRCLIRNGCELKEQESVIDIGIEALDEYQKNELCKKVKVATKEIQRFVWRYKGKDIYKKLKNFKYLQYQPESEVMFDINTL